MRRILNAGISTYQLPIKTIRGALTVYKSNGNSNGVYAKKIKGYRRNNTRNSKGLFGSSKTIFSHIENKNGI